MIALDEALNRIRGTIAPLDAETVPVGEAAGRTLAADAAARRTQPPFAGSAMDGYAVRSADLTGMIIPLRLAGEAAAGHASAQPLEAGQAQRISTGAPLPTGADQVVVQENVARDGDIIRLGDAAAPGRHVRPAGLDFREGDRLLGAGRRLSPADIALMAAAGFSSIEVRRRPRIALLCNGDELAEPGETLRSGQIVNSVAPALLALLREWGAEPAYLGIARDDPGEVRARLSGLSGQDGLVTVGGASVGDHDHLRRVFEDLGGRLAFEKIAVKPGKPTWFGQLQGACVLGLPGNPVSALVMARLVVKTAIDAWSGRAEAAVYASAVSGTTLEANGPRETFLRASLDPLTGKAAPLPNQDSSALSALAAADCLIRRPSGAPACPAGTPVDILPLRTP